MSLCLACMALLWTACNKPTPFGANLVDEQADGFAFTDTLTTLCTVQREDSVITSSTSSYYLCGELNDPIFGKSSAELYTLFSLENLDPGFEPAKTTLDSVVMYMHYSSSGVYGDTLQPQILRVLRLTDPIQWDSNYFTDDQRTAGVEIGRVNDFLPRPRTSKSLFSTTSTAPYLRVKLDTSFGNYLLNIDSLTSSSDTSFWRKIKGLKIVTSSGSAVPGAMLSFNLDETGYSRIRLYYHTDGDTTAKAFNYYFSGAKKFSHYSHEYDGTQAGSKINQQSDDLLYLQSMQGLRVKLEFPTANKLDNLIVNKADLEFTVAKNVIGDLPSTLFPADQVVLTQIQGDSTFVFTSDVLYSLGSTLSEGFTRFGGYPETDVVNGVEYTHYHLSLSAVFQKMVDDAANDPKNRTVYLSIYPQNRSAQRLIIYGPKSPIYPLKLNLKYTRLD